MLLTVTNDPGEAQTPLDAGVPRAKSLIHQWAPFVHEQRHMSAPGSTIVLAERLEMSQATALHAQLLDALKARAPLVVDASAVQVVDSASAQVLVAFALSAKEARVDLSWQRSPAFDDFFQRTALASAIT